MQFKTFGSDKNPVIIFLHGGGLSWWSWKPQIDVFQKDYFVVAAIIDGHGEDWETPFVSIRNSAWKVIDYVNEKCDGRIFAICGLSIGAQISVEILSEKKNITKYAVIESALVKPIKKTVAWMAPLYKLSYGLIKRRWFARLQAKTLNVPDDLFENYFEDSSRMKIESLINMTQSNGNYSMKQTLEFTHAKVLILVGDRELEIMKKSALLLSKTIEDSTLKVIRNSGHGALSLINHKTYISILKDFFKT